MSNRYRIEEGLSDKASKPVVRTLLAVTGVLVIGSSILYSANQFTLVGVNERLSEIGADVFLKYLFIVVAVERAAAVFVGMFRSQNRVDWALRINRIGEVLQMDNPPIAVLKQVHARENRLIRKLTEKKIIGKIADIPGVPTPEDYLGYLTSAKHAYEFQKARFDSTSNRYVSRSVFFIGILLAALGLSIFHDLLQHTHLVEMMADETGNGTPSGLVLQTGLLRFADIIVTGGLLGGGSAGLNAIANRVTEFLNNS